MELRDVAKVGRSEGRVTEMESINLKDNDALGELADLYHSHKSWYSLNGATSTGICHEQKLRCVSKCYSCFCEII